MPATESFSYYYSLGSSFGPTTTYGSSNSGSWSITDSADNGDDNQTIQGGAVTTNAGTGGSLEYSFVGFTANGEPILEGAIPGIGPFEYIILSNTDYAPATTIGSTVNGNYLYCFAAGTMIATPKGETAVETLAIGDMLTDARGNTVAVKWIGRQTVSTRFGPAERLMPVRFAAGSLGEGVPHTDLTVTADHGMLVDGVICHAGALVNGTTITRVSFAEMGETYTVYHIETEEHEIILANGARAETFIDNVSRRVFDNYAEFEALYGDVPEMEELPYPRAMSVRQVPERIKAKRAGKAVA